MQRKCDFSCTGPARACKFKHDMSCMIVCKCVNFDKEFLFLITDKGTLSEDTIHIFLRQIGKCLQTVYYM